MSSTTPMQSSSTSGGVQESKASTGQQPQAETGAFQVLESGFEVVSRARTKLTCKCESCGGNSQNKFHPSYTLKHNKTNRNHTFYFVGHGTYKAVYYNEALKLMFNCSRDQRQQLSDPSRLAHKFYDLAEENKELYNKLYGGTVKFKSFVLGYMSDYIPDIKLKQAFDIEIFMVSNGQPPCPSC